MKRPMTLVSTILSVSFSSIVAVALLVIFFQVETEIAAHQRTVIYIFLVFLMLCIVGTIVFNALSISLWNKQYDIYKKKDIFLNCAIAFNFVSVTGTIVLSFIGFNNWVILSVIEALAGVTSAVLLIVDMSLEKARVEKTKRTSGIKQSVVNPAKQKSKIQSLTDNLNRLQKMFDKGLINKEEYQRLRNARIEEEKAKTAPKLEQKTLSKAKSKLEIQLETLDGMKEEGIISEEDYKKLKTALIKESLK